MMNFMCLLNISILVLLLRALLLLRVGLLTLTLSQSTAGPKYSLTELLCWRLGSQRHGCLTVLIHWWQTFFSCNHNGHLFIVSVAAATKR